MYGRQGCRIQLLETGICPTCETRICETLESIRCGMCPNIATCQSPGGYMCDDHCGHAGDGEEACRLFDPPRCAI